MDNQLLNYLASSRDAVFKLLPMKEEELKGADNHLNDFIDSLIVNIEGAMTTYSVLTEQKSYLWVVNNINFLRKNEVDFRRWRSIILNSTKKLNNLYVFYGGIEDGE